MFEPLEAALLDLEREMAYTAWVMRDQRMTNREMAIYHNSLAMNARSAEYQHKADAERARHERIAQWRRERRARS